MCPEKYAMIFLYISFIDFSILACVNFIQFSFIFTVHNWAEFILLALAWVCVCAYVYLPMWLCSNNFRSNIIFCDICNICPSVYLPVWIFGSYDIVFSCSHIYFNSVSYYRYNIYQIRFPVLAYIPYYISRHTLTQLNDQLKAIVLQETLLQFN